MKKDVTWGAALGMAIIAIVCVFGSKKLDEWHCARYSKITGKVTKFDFLNVDGCFVATEKGTFVPMSQIRGVE